MLYQFLPYSEVNLLYIYPLFFRFFSHIGHYRVLSRGPCAIQQVLISYLFYIQQCVYFNPNLPIYPSPTLHPGNHKFIFNICNSISVLQISSFVQYFLDSICKQNLMLSVFLCLTHFTQYDNIQVQPCCCKWHFLVLFMANIPLYICTTTSLPIPLSINV